jgi:pilus assembly protein Flp/PilA
MKKMMNWLMEEESGQGMVEYGLILALISVVVVATLGLIGTNLDLKFNDVNDEID